eukprot:19687-Heterococcus_DN1.PRE.3
MLLCRAPRSLCLRARLVPQSGHSLVRLISVHSREPPDTKPHSSSKRGSVLQHRDTHSAQADAVKRDGATTSTQQHRLRIHIAQLGMQMRGHDVLLVLNSARSKGLALNVYIYAAAITALGRCKQHQQALKLLTQMEAEGIAPNVVVYNALIHVARAGSGRKH